MSPVPPEWPAAAAVFAVGWRLRPRHLRAVPGRAVDPADGVASPSPRHSAITVEPGWRSRWPRSWARRSKVDASAAASWCDGIARSLRGGATLGAAIVEAPRTGAIDDALGDAVLRLRRGGTVIDVADRIHEDATSPHLALVATVLRTLATHGGPAAEPVDRAAAVLRQRAAAEAERVTHSAQARLSARVMTLLPIAMLALVSITSPSVRAALATPVGLATVTVGACCNLVGWWWMRRIIAGGQQ